MQTACNIYGGGWLGGIKCLSSQTCHQSLNIPLPRNGTSHGELGLRQVRCSPPPHKEMEIFMEDLKWTY